MLTDYRIASWTEQDGLPAGTIWSIAQDVHGFLWLGSDAGLIRFDGARFATPESLGMQLPSSGPVPAVVASPNGDLWFGQTSGQITRISNGDVKVFGQEHGLPSATVTSLVRDTDGGVLAATERGLYRFEAERWHQVANAGLPALIQSVSVAASGDVIVGSRDTVYRSTAGSERFSAIAESDEPVVDAVEDHAGQVWVTDRIAGYRRATTPSGAPNLQNGKGMRLLVDRDGHLWVATFGQGLWRVRANERTRPVVDVATDLNGLSNNVIYALFEDRDSNIWVGTTDGLNRLTQHRVTNIPSLGLVTGLEPGANGRVWAATTDAIVKLSPTGEELRRFNGIQARATHADPDGTLWAATDDALIRVDPVTDRTEVVTRAARNIRSITSHPDGGLWIVDTELGMLRWAESRLEPIAVPADINGRPSFLFTDRRGTVWIAMAAGRLIAIGPNGAARSYGGSEGLDIGSAREIFEDSRGVLWIAGSRGLGRFAGGRFTTLHRGGGLTSESLTAVLEDEAGDIWIGAATGLIRIAAAAVGPGGDRETYDQYAVYDSSDGVAGTTGWIGQGSALRGSDGRFWFLTASGITIVDPAALGRDNNKELTLSIGRVTADDTRLSVAAGTTIEPGVRRLQIEYTLPNVTSPRRTRFRYRLEGFDTDWIEAGRQRQAVYTNLSPGAYTFVVEATTNSGSWEGPRASWDFTVLPAFYQTTWFFLACGIGAVLLGWTTWRLRVHQMRKQYALLLAERTRLSRELHDTLLQSFVGIALQCDALADAEDSASPSLRTGLIRLRRQVEGYIRECRQAIWDLRSPASSELDLIAALRETSARAAQAGGLELTLEVSGTPRSCARRIEEQLLRIVQEATNNAARHSRGTRLRVTVAYHDDAIEARIADNGRGFDPADPVHRLHGHCGLISMRERAESVGGTLEITSSGVNGAAVDVIVPLVAAEGPIDADPVDPDSLRGRSPDRARGDRADHQPAA